MDNIWLLMCICGVLTFLTRFIPLSGYFNRMPQVLQAGFKFIPVCFFIPIIIFNVVIDGSWQQMTSKSIALLIALWVGIRYHSFMLTLLIGMVSYQLLFAVVSLLF